MTSSINCCCAMPAPLATTGGGADAGPTAPPGVSAQPPAPPGQPGDATVPVGVTGGGADPTAPTGPVPVTTAGGGPTAPAGNVDIATAIAGLTQAIGALTSLLQAQAGAGQVTTGGGPGTNPSGGCASGTGVTDGAIAGAAIVPGGGGQAPAGPGAADASALPYDANASIVGGGPTQAPGKPDQVPGQAPTQGTSQAPPNAATPVRDQIVAAARAELAKGVREDAGPDADSGGNIVRYRSAVTGPGEDPNVAEAWCADFASYVWKQAGVPFGANGQGEDFTPFMVDQAKTDGSWKTADPKPGDMVLLDWEGGRGAGDDRGKVDHVAIVDRVENGRVYTIGGNQGDAVSAADYPADSNLILGYVAPKGG